MRILFLTHRLPYAPNRGDRLRAYHILQWLRQRASVTLVSFVHSNDEAAHVEDMRSLVTSVTAVRVPVIRNHLRALATLATEAPLTHALLDARGMPAIFNQIVGVDPPHVVFAFGSGMAQFALRPPLSGLPLVLDLVDVDSRKWRDLAATARFPLSWIYRREARVLAAFESRAATLARATLVVNDREAALASQLAPAGHVQVLANGVDVAALNPRRPATARARVVFCGVMNYAPNDQGVRWFVKEVWPLVRAQRPDATLAIVGSDPRPGLTALCAADHSIEITGRVADVREQLWNSAVAIAPLLVARGVQNKALEAIAAGLPIVVTSAVADGLPSQTRPAITIADGAGVFAQGVVNLLAMSPDARRAVAASANLSQLEWATTLEPLTRVLAAAASMSSHEP